jgi:hypothetical protein
MRTVRCVGSGLSGESVLHTADGSRAQSPAVFLPTFYEDATKLTPDGKLGQVLKKEGIPTNTPGADAWRVAYVSSDALERKTVVTAVVIAPKGAVPKGGHAVVGPGIAADKKILIEPLRRIDQLGRTAVLGRPIISWAHGTTGTAGRRTGSQPSTQRSRKTFPPSLPFSSQALVDQDRKGSILLKNSLLWRRRCASATTAVEAKPGLSASCGEDWRREGDELRQLPQILGGGGQ